MLVLPFSCLTVLKYAIEKERPTPRPLERRETPDRETPMRTHAKAVREDLATVQPARACGARAPPRGVEGRRARARGGRARFGAKVRAT